MIRQKMEVEIFTSGEDRNWVCRRLMKNQRDSSPHWNWLTFTWDEDCLAPKYGVCDPL